MWRKNINLQLRLWSWVDLTSKHLETKIAICSFNREKEEMYLKLRRRLTRWSFESLDLATVCNDMFDVIL